MVPVNNNIHLEIKPLGDIINIHDLENLILNFNISMVIHGHKHLNNDFYTYITNNKENNSHQVLIASSADTSKQEMFKIFDFKYLKVNIANYDDNNNKIRSESYSLFNNIESKSSVILESDSITRLFGKIQSYFSINSSEHKKLLTCTLNLKNYQNICPIRKLYKYSHEQESFKKAVKRYTKLWLQEKSLYEDEIPIHGIRLKNYKGYFNQLKYITNIIQNTKSKSRGVAILLDPVKDFQIEHTQEEKTDYPSFISCQVVVREDKYLDIIANYRSQEMHYWWQLNIAELWELLCEIRQSLRGEYTLGKITTITPLPSFADKTAFGRAYVSLIDYYADFDEEKEKLPYLAHSLVCNNNIEKKVINEYNEIFENLLEFTKIKSNKDGNSRLREGVRHFNSHLKTATNGLPKYNNFISSMEGLENAIEIFNSHDEKSENSNQQYENDMKNIREAIKKAQNEFKNLIETCSS
jgi:hypothetical protein